MGGLSYGQSEYWDRRYTEQQELHYEWFPEAIEKMIAVVKGQKPGPLLELGCGSSVLAVRLFQDTACRPILAVDISQAAIQKCKSSAPRASELTFTTMDCCNLEVPDNSWDFVIDKGTMDAVDCADKTAAMVREVARVLRPGGHFLMASCREPLQRTAQLQQFFTMKDFTEMWGSNNQRTPCPDVYMYHFVPKEADPGP
ncbi:hypothetical protein WJX73_008053 [Symbiochloris irregularis]|uniref:Methyltransferase domain-containing protein n=1 Tax=Symbiochloris irregularis TaxID=706552 RepID=A0AAW1NH02_9CHLO